MHKAQRAKLLVSDQQWRSRRRKEAVVKNIFEGAIIRIGEGVSGCAKGGNQTEEGGNEKGGGGSQKEEGGNNTGEDGNHLPEGGS